MTHSRNVAKDLNLGHNTEDADQLFRGRNVDIYRQQASGSAVTEERYVDVRMTQPLRMLSLASNSGLHKCDWLVRF